MVLKTELHTHEIPDIFYDFKKVVGEDFWLKRVKLITQEIKGYKYLEDYLRKENSIAFSLFKYSMFIRKYGGIPIHEIENREHYPSISFAAQALSIIEHAPKQCRNALIRRIQGAFSNPDDMRAIQLEILAATHFVRRGYSVSWPEMDHTGNFDLLVNDIGNNGLEVECKSISRDKGKRIHQREEIEFYHLIKKEIKSVIKGLKVGLSVVLSIPGRLPKPFNKRKILATKISKQIIFAHSKSFEDGSIIRITEFDFNIVTDKLSTSLPDVSLIDEITGTNNRGAMIIGNGCGGGVVFSMQSNKDDALLEYVFNILKTSAKNQLSKTRPASFFVGFYDIERDALNELAKHDDNVNNQPTLLRKDVSGFLSSSSCDHVVSVNFLDDGALIPQENGDVSNSGTVYAFKNDDCIFWHEDFDGLFQ